MRYEKTWRNKHLGEGAHDIGRLAELLLHASEELREMESQGVRLVDDEGVQDDYATLVTSDPAVAAHFRFDPWEKAVLEADRRISAMGLARAKCPACKKNDWQPRHFRRGRRVVMACPCGQTSELQARSASATGRVAVTMVPAAKRSKK